MVNAFAVSLAVGSVASLALWALLPVSGADRDSALERRYLEPEIYWRTLRDAGLGTSVAAVLWLARDDGQREEGKV